MGEIIQSSGGPHYLSAIPLKDSHLFKISESVISFCFKKFSNSTILNMCESFNKMVDHVTCLPCEPYNFLEGRVLTHTFSCLKLSPSTVAVQRVFPMVIN